jgi:hypothetical protein
MYAGAVLLGGGDDTRGSTWRATSRQGGYGGGVTPGLRRVVAALLLPGLPLFFMGLSFFLPDEISGWGLGYYYAHLVATPLVILFTPQWLSLAAVWSVVGTPDGWASVVLVCLAAFPVSWLYVVVAERLWCRVRKYCAAPASKGQR